MLVNPPCPRILVGAPCLRTGCCACGRKVPAAARGPVSAGGTDRGLIAARGGEGPRMKVWWRRPARGEGLGVASAAHALSVSVTSAPRFRFGRPDGGRPARDDGERRGGFSQRDERRPAPPIATKAASAALAAVTAVSALWRVA